MLIAWMHRFCSWTSLLECSSEFLCPLCAASFFHVRDQIRKIHTKKAETEIQTSKQKLRRNVFGMHAVRGNVTKPGSAKGKPQFATKPGSTKGKGPSSPLAWVNKRQWTIRHYLLSVHLRDAIFALQTFVFLQICVEVFRTCSLDNSIAYVRNKSILIVGLVASTRRRPQPMKTQYICMTMYECVSDMCSRCVPSRLIVNVSFHRLRLSLLITFFRCGPLDVKAAQSDKSRTVKFLTFQDEGIQSSISNGCEWVFFLFTSPKCLLTGPVYEAFMKVMQWEME